MLLQMFDSDLLDSIFYEKFDKYLVNLLNFGSGLAVPILKYANYKDESLSENSNDVLLIKTLTPLDESLVEGTNFYISQNSYSDDIVKNTEDTMTLLEKYIDDLDITLSKKRLKNTMKSLYNEAQDLEL